ncbi:MAG: nuclear transport factor 2 family protein [Solirubrobacteraceae bacterium]
MTVDELSDAWLAAWSSGDASAFAPLCAASLHYEDPLTAAPLHDSGALAGHARRLWAGLPDARVEAAGPRPRDDRFVAIPWRLRGTHTAPLGALPATRRFVAVPGLFYCELDGPGPGAPGPRMLRVRGIFDVYDAGVQLGILPGRGTLGERALLVLRGFGLRMRGA